MTEAFLKELGELDFDSLTAKEAVMLRSALTEALTKANGWFLGLAQGFGLAAPNAKPQSGRPPETPPQNSPTAGGEPSPVKPPHRRRGRPVPSLKVDLHVNRKKPLPAPIAVGGADAATEGPEPAQIFQDSYVSKDGPRPGAALPPDHPRNFQRPSSVTPEVDMSDFHEAEEAMRKGTLGKVFQ